MKKLILSFIIILTAAAYMLPVANAQPSCAANFQYSIGVTTPNGTSISFYDSSFAAGTITNWNWAFTSGQTSTLQNPVINILPGGPTVIQACLTITAIFQNQTCTSTFCDTLYLTAFPSCDPSFTTTINPSGVAVFAANGITNTSWTWDFGDGTSGTGAVITHVYSAPGTYQACLVVVDASGSTCTSCQSVVVGTSSVCNAAFTYSTIQGTTLVAFANQSTGSATSYIWDFGDGSTSTALNPTHAYTGAGPYQVCLTIADSATACFDTYCDSVVLNNTGSCLASFNFSTTPASNTVAFTNTSTVPPGSTYTWDFGDGTTSTSTSPTHTYAATGTYVVCLSVLDATTGVILCTHCSTVVVGGVINCQANFTWTADSLGIQFTNTSTGNPTNYSWMFGNGTTSILENPYVNFSTAGWYNVCLTIWTVNGNCQSTYCDSVYFGGGTGGGCSSNFAIYPDTVIAHNYFAINLASGVAPLSYLWSWGDGTSSTAAYPSHTYAAAGLYTICLTISDATGCTSSTCYQWQLLRLSGSSVPVTINVIPGTVGLVEQLSVGNGSIFPNPASDKINIEFTNETNLPAEINIYSLTGQFVTNLGSTSDRIVNMSANISDLTSGIYIMKISTSKATQHIKLIVEH